MQAQRFSGMSGRPWAALLRRRPIMKNLASIALAIAVLCVANYAGAHETDGHNARTSHALRDHQWHDHKKARAC